MSSFDWSIRESTKRRVLCRTVELGTYRIRDVSTRVNQKVKAFLKLRGNWERQELAHCAVLTVPVEEFSHV